MNATANQTSIAIERYWLIVCVAVAIAVVPLYSAELYVLANLSMYQFFPLVYAFAGYVGWKRWHSAEGTIGHRAGKSFWPEIACIVAAFGCLTIHAGLFGPWLGGAAGLAAGAAGVLSIARLRRVQWWDLWCLLVISSRLPLDLNFKLSTVLQSFSSQLSSLALDAFGVVHVLAGNIVKLPSGDLFVDVACSGVISVMSIIACSAIVAIWNDRQWLHTMLLFASGIFYAMLMNVVRIVIIAYAKAIFDFDLSHGWVHEMLGVLIFLVTFSCLVKTDYLLLAILEASPESSTALSNQPSKLSAFRKLADFRLFPSPPRTSNSMTEVARSIVDPPKIRFAVLACLGVVMGLYHSYALYASFTQSAANSTGIVAKAKDIELRQVAAAVAPWTIVHDELLERDTLSELAPFSKSYTLQHPTLGTKVTLSFDFPFYRKWHDVTKCYVAGGWSLKSRVVHRETKQADLQDCEFISADFQSTSLGYGHLLFANLNQDGRLVAPPPDFGDLGYTLNQIVHVFQQTRQVSLNPNKLFQIQVFSTESKVQSPELRNEMEELFYKSFKELRRILIDISKTDPE